MKNLIKIIAVILLLSTNAFAQATAAQLMNAGMPAEQAVLVAAVFTGGATVSNNAYIKGRDVAGSANINLFKIDASDNTVINSSASDELILQLADDANRVISFTAASDTALVMTFGDNSTTANQALTVSGGGGANDDDTQLNLAGGSSAVDDEGAFISIAGNESSSNGNLTLTAGDISGSVMTFSVEQANSTFVFKDVTTGDLVTITDAGAITKAGANDISLSVGLATIAFQESVSSSACTGTTTTNGTTAVTVSTTCATTGSRIFIARTGDATGTAANDQSGCWTTNIQNGTSFDLDCSDTGDNGTMNWVIFHESA